MKRQIDIFHFKWSDDRGSITLPYHKRSTILGVSVTANFIQIHVCYREGDADPEDQADCLKIHFTDGDTVEDKCGKFVGIVRVGMSFYAFTDKDQD